MTLSQMALSQVTTYRGNGDREAVVVGAGLCDGEGERAYIAYAPRNIFAFGTHIRSKRG